MLSKLKGWPIVGRLWEVPPDALHDARDEIVSAIFWSTMPFWILPILGIVIFAQPADFLGPISNGELFVYSATLLGPLAYVIHKRYGRFRAPRESEDDEGEPLSYTFPYGRTFSYVVAMSCILSGVVFSIQRMKDIDALKHIKFVNDDGLFWLSVASFFVANLVLFCVLAYRNMLKGLEQKHSENISGALKRDEDRAIAEWSERKGK